jgi:hypothetical protein
VNVHGEPVNEASDSPSIDSTARRTLTSSVAVTLIVKPGSTTAFVAG